jgi:hypothetical protein
MEFLLIGTIVSVKPETLTNTSSYILIKIENPRTKEIYEIKLNPHVDIKILEESIGKTIAIFFILTTYSKEGQQQYVFAPRKIEPYIIIEDHLLDYIYISE